MGNNITENQVLYLTCPIPPSVNHYLAYRVVNKNGRQMAMSYETKEAREFKKAFTSHAREQAEIQKWVKSENKFQRYFIDTIFFFPRIDMDCNNYWKLPFDCITESENIWIDDTQACERVKAVFIDSKNPRMEMKIHPVGFKGIFKNIDLYDCFIDKCKTCKRIDKNCSILNKAIEGRIQDEIKEYECCKYSKK